MEAIEPIFQMWIALAIITAGIISYSLNKVPMEITSLGIIAALLIFFQLFPILDDNFNSILGPRELLAGFADPALITIISLLIVGHGLVKTGALDSTVNLLLHYGKQRPGVILILSLMTVVFVSAFLNDTPVVVIFIPIMITLVERLGKSPSLYLIPLSYAAILGGMTTLIGSSTNLLVSSTYQSVGGEALGFFDFVIPDAFLASIGFIYIVFIAPSLLPNYGEKQGNGVRFTGKHFLIQFTLTAGNSLIGTKTVAGMFPMISGMTIQMVRRKNQKLFPPFDDINLTKGDQLTVATTRQELKKRISEDLILFSDAKTYDQVDLNAEQPMSRGQRLVEVIVAPYSKLDGVYLDQTEYALPGGSKILGIQRKSRMNRVLIDDIQLRSGDTLLVTGSHPQIQSLRLNNDLLPLEWSSEEIPFKEDTWKALSIFFGFVFLGSTGILPVATAAFIAAISMIITGCITVRNAANAIERKIFLLIGAALAMGASLQATGGASFLAMSMVAALEGASPAIILSAFFLLIAFMTNILSNNATAVLFTPIAVSISAELSVDPFIFVTTVIFAANCSFATPMGYQTNLLVLGPGNYKFSDFLKVGIPLILILWIGYSFFAPWYYDL